MTTVSASVLTAFIGWSLLLLILMEALRTRLVVKGTVKSNAFAPDNANLSPFMQRLSRAHANCLEGLPLFGGLLLVAIATDRASVARVVQSSVHLLSLSVTAVNARFFAFAVQMGIAAYWVWALLAR